MFVNILLFYPYDKNFSGIEIGGMIIGIAIMLYGAMSYYNYMKRRENKKRKFLNWKNKKNKKQKKLKKASTEVDTEGGTEAKSGQFCRKALNLVEFIAEQNKPIILQRYAAAAV